MASGRCCSVDVPRRFLCNLPWKFFVIPKNGVWKCVGLLKDLGLLVPKIHTLKLFGELSQDSFAHIKCF